MEFFDRIKGYIRPKILFVPSDAVDSDDKILEVVRRHPIYFVSKIFLTILLVFIVFPAVFIYSFGWGFFEFILSPLGFLLFVLWLITGISYFAYFFLIWYQDSFIFTEKFVIDVDQKSIFTRNVSKIGWENVQDVTFTHKGFFEVFFDIGEVIVRTANQESDVEIFPVANPKKVAVKISQMASSLTDKRLKAISDEQAMEVAKKEARIELFKDEVLRKMKEEEERKRKEKMPKYLDNNSK